MKVGNQMKGAKVKDRLLRHVNISLIFKCNSKSVNVINHINIVSVKSHVYPNTYRKSI